LPRPEDDARNERAKEGRPMIDTRAALTVRDRILELRRVLDVDEAEATKLL
jgi:hypothetical protein